MPLDFGLLDQGPRINTPFENLSQILQVRQQQESARGLAEQRQAIAEQRRAQTDALQRDAEREARLTALFSTNPKPTRADIMKADPSENGQKIATAIDALQDADLKRYQDQRAVTKEAIAGLNALPENMRPNGYGAIRQTFIARGWATPEDIPEQYDPKYVAGIQQSMLSPEKQYDIDNPKPTQIGTQLVKPNAAGVYEAVYTAPADPKKGLDEYLDAYAAARNIPRAKLPEGMILEATRKYEAAQRAPRVVDPVAQELAQLRLADAKRDSGLRTQAGEMPAPYQSVIGRVLVNAPATRRKAIENGFTQVWATGNEAELKDQIRNAAIQTEDVETKKQVLGRMATKASLDDAAAIMKEMQAKGVPTGFFTGTVEDLVRKVGKTTNPEYVALANRLQGTLINYRRAATGAAFGEREGAAYEKMFPNYRNDLPVNMALIQGLQREMQTYDDVYWDSKLGKEGRALVFGTTPTNQAKPGVAAAGTETPEHRVWRVGGKLGPEPK